MGRRMVYGVYVISVLFSCFGLDGLIPTLAKVTKPEAMLPFLDVLVVTTTGGVSSVDEMVPGMERRRRAIMPP